MPVSRPDRTHPAGCVEVGHPASGWTAVVDPRRGATVRSFRAADGWELFARGYPADEAPHPGDPFGGSGLTGHVDCLPTIDAATGGLPGRPDLPADPLVDHGPLWALPWESLGAGGGSEGVWARFGAEVPGWSLPVTRTVSVGAARLRLDYTMTNSGDAPLPVLWAGHGLLATPSGSRVQASGWRPPLQSSTTKTHGLDEAAADDLLAAVGDPRGLAVDAAPVGTWVKAYAPWPAEGAWLLRDDARVHVEASVPGARLWLGLWLNQAGMPVGAPLRHVALEPTTGDHDSLSECVARRTCWWVPERTTVSWSMGYTVHRS